MYFDLATWHLINTVYTPKCVGELQLMRHLYPDTHFHDRLMRVVERFLGHALTAHAEEAKIDVAAGGTTSIDMEEIEESLRVAFNEVKLIDAGKDETRRSVESAKATVKLAGVSERDVGAIYLTGGMTGLRFLSDAFLDAKVVFGDRLASVATGLGIYAQRVFA